MKNRKIATIVTGLAGLGIAVVLTGCGGSNGLVGGNQRVFRQQERLARPLTNEALATFANNQHQLNNVISPAQDASELRPDIIDFMVNGAGRSPATAETLAAVLVPDVLVADLSQAGPAAYLGVETGGVTGGTFGGRKFADDVVDIDLGAVFGTTLSDLGLVAPDGNQIPSLTSDNVAFDASKSIGTFPYLAGPR